MSLSKVTAWQCSFCKRIFKGEWPAVRHAKKCWRNESLRSCHTCKHSDKDWREDGGYFYCCMLSPNRPFVYGDGRIYHCDGRIFHCDGWQPKKKVKHVNSPAKERTQ